MMELAAWAADPTREWHQAHQSVKTMLTDTSINNDHSRNRLWKELLATKESDGYGLDGDATLHFRTMANLASSVSHADKHRYTTPSTMFTDHTIGATREVTSSTTSPA